MPTAMRSWLARVRWMSTPRVLLALNSSDTSGCSSAAATRGSFDGCRDLLVRHELGLQDDAGGGVDGLDVEVDGQDRRAG